MKALSKLFSRLFKKHVRVYSGMDFTKSFPEVHAARGNNNEIKIYSLVPDIKIKSSGLINFNNLICNTKGIKFQDKYLNVHGSRIKFYNIQDIKISKSSLLNFKSARNALKIMLQFPQERPNKLKWQKLRPTLAPGEMVIAWYGPIVDGAVLKLVLNKQPGTLMIWYDARSRHFKSKGLFLCRRLDSGSRPEWRWM